jgi:tRNA nucleotidyltransferase/poly(A) polymerase
MSGGAGAGAGAGSGAGGNGVGGSGEGAAATRSPGSPLRKRARIGPVELHDISLTPAETELVQVLKGTLSRFGLKTEVRIAGGWVRDKLLGRNSNDVDVALDDTTGAAFARLVNEHLALDGHKTCKIGVIAANPEQSKHLETATFNVLGLAVDFVNLRSEQYCVDSRIPKVLFGSAREDAERRDFTINSLFYNVNKGELEDLTGQGLADLRSGVIRTPLPPARTFCDDPLRMLRAVRFASRFRFALDPSVEEALRRPDNVQALASKISRERVGAEVAAMLRGPNPQDSVELLARFELLPLVFAVPEPPAAANPGSAHAALLAAEIAQGPPGLADGSLARAAVAGMDWLARAQFAAALRANVGADLLHSRGVAEGDPELLYLLALLHGLEKVPALNAKYKSEPLSVVIVRDSLKMRAALAFQVRQVSDAVAPVLAAAHRLRGRSHAQQQQPTLTPSPTPPEAEAVVEQEQQARLEFGRLLFELKELFPLALCLAATIEPETQAALQLVDDRVHNAWAIANVWAEALPFNGKELIDALEFPKGGPYVGHMMALQRDWVVLNRPLASESAEQRKQRCKAHLIALKDKVMTDDEERQRKAKEQREEDLKRRKLDKDLKRKEKESAAAAAAAAMMPTPGADKDETISS